MKLYAVRQEQKRRGTEKSKQQQMRIEKYEENMRKCVFYPISEGNRKTKLW